MKKPKRIHRQIPKFMNEDEEWQFWDKHEGTDYLDWSQAKRVTFPDLKPSTTTISLRLPEAMLENLKALANKRDVPYQSLLKVFLAERLHEEFNPPSRRLKKAS